MKKASSSFLVLFFAALLSAFQSYAQVSREGNRITERVQQNLRMHERLRLSDLLRLSYQEQSSIEILSLIISAQSLQGQAQLELSQHGRPLATEVVRKQLKEIKFALPQRTFAEGLELSSASEIFLESVTAEVSYSRPAPIPPRPSPGYEQQPVPNSMITLSVNQQVRGYAVIPLEQLARQQLGLSLTGAQIERVVVQGQPSMYGRAASVQVQINQRLIGQAKYLSSAQKQTPIPLQSFEEVYSLGLVVSGDALISEVRIRFGAVRPRQPELPRTQRIYVGREVQSRMALELSHLLPYEQRMITSITVEARSLRYAQADLALVSIYGGVQGTLYVSSYSQKQVIRLMRPIAASELRFQSASSVHIEALEIEFEQYPRY